MNQTIFREPTCVSERGRGGRESSPPFAHACAFTEYSLVHETRGGGSLVKVPA